MKALWCKDVEKEFFEKSLDSFSKPEQLFYKTDDNRYVAYWPKNYKGKKTTLQSRNTLIGKFTETWITTLLQKIVEPMGFYAIQGGICEDFVLTSQSNADVLITKKNSIIQQPSDICLIIEVKMSLIWNWEYDESNKQLKCLGDYKTHQGNPSLLRSDSMLKAIGKGLNIRISHPASNRIPIIIFGNSPIKTSYLEKVDKLKKSGIIQGFYSVNPMPIEADDNIKSTLENGFFRFDNYMELKDEINKLLELKLNFFSSMKTKKELGFIIEKANRKSSYEDKASEFLKLLEE
ncbi:MAG: hypothetical protein ACLFSQ_09730 [Candidatus Zixiibacteriota bacterium]